MRRTKVREHGIRQVRLHDVRDPRFRAAERRAQIVEHLQFNVPRQKIHPRRRSTRTFAHRNDERLAPLKRREDRKQECRHDRKRAQSERCGRERNRSCKAMLRDDIPVAERQQRGPGVIDRHPKRIRLRFEFTAQREEDQTETEDQRNDPENQQRDEQQRRKRAKESLAPRVRLHAHPDHAGGAPAAP